MPGLHTPQSAIDFLPGDAFQEHPLYRMVAEGIDWALTPNPAFTEEELEEFLRTFQFQYTDTEAANAYYYTHVKPIIGTRNAMEFAFSVFNVNAVITEWFDSEVPLGPYKFTVTFDTYPGAFDFAGLVSMINALKNERSRLASLSMRDCAESLVLSFGYLDDAYLSASEGAFDETLGIFICLKQNFRNLLQWGQLYPPVVRATQTHIRTSFYRADRDDLLDDFTISMPFTARMRPIIGSYATLNFSVVEVPDPVVHDYHTGTFLAQVVLSDYGILSDGLGFIGVHEEGPPDQELMDLSGFSLSEAPQGTSPLLQFFWIVRSNSVQLSSFTPQLYHQYSSLDSQHYPFARLAGASLSSDFRLGDMPERMFLATSIQGITSQRVSAYPNPVKSTRSATFQAQIVLSEQGVLSDGTGFIGLVEDFGDAFLLRNFEVEGGYGSPNNESDEFRYPEDLYRNSIPPYSGGFDYPQIPPIVRFGFQIQPQRTLYTYPLSSNDPHSFGVVAEVSWINRAKQGFTINPSIYSHKLSLDENSEDLLLSEEGYPFLTEEGQNISLG